MKIVLPDILGYRITIEGNIEVPDQTVPVVPKKDEPTEREPMKYEEEIKDLIREEFFSQAKTVSQVRDKLGAEPSEQSFVDKTLRILAEEEVISSRANRGILFYFV